MKAFNDYDTAKKAAESQGITRLPAGAYVCKIKQVRYEKAESADKGDRIVMAFDITEGEYKDYFQKQFDADTNEDKKWKGRVTVWVPKDDGSEMDATTKKRFAGWTAAFESSNSGYTWDWDETKWKDKIVGIVFGETGTVIDGKEIVYTEARYGAPVEDVRSGKEFKTKFLTKNGYKGGNGGSGSAASDDSFMNIPAGSKEELPF